jgi:pimeloyl-ACP methyl ester carboxylesterase
MVNLVLAALPPAAVLLALAVRAWLQDRALIARRPAPGARVGPRGQQLHLIERPGPAGGPSLVFLHGNPGCALDFVHLQDRLAGRVRSFSVDRPGFGWSERGGRQVPLAEQARRVRGALGSAGVKDVVLVGFSYGSPVSLAYAAAHPDEVKALVLLVPVGDAEARYRMDAAQAMLAWPFIGALMSWTVAPLAFPAAARAGWKKAFAPCAVVDAVVRDTSPLVGRPACLAASASDWAGLQGPFRALSARLGELRMPVEILAASGDQVLGPSHARVLSEKLPGANLVTLTDAGHQVMHTHPDEVLAAIDRALQRAGALSPPR